MLIGSGGIGGEIRGSEGLNPTAPSLLWMSMGEVVGLVVVAEAACWSLMRLARASRAVSVPTYSAQHSTAQHSTAQHSTAQHSIAQLSTAPIAQAESC